MFVFTLDFIRYGIPDMQRFISRSLLQSRSISRPLGSLSFLISTFWWLRSPLVFGMSSRTSTTNVFSVSRSSNIYKFWNGKFVNNFSKIEVMDCIIHFERIFQLFWFFFAVVLYACSAVYFAGVMVRLMLTLTPVVCVLSAIAFSRLLQLYLKVRHSNHPP